MSAAPNLRAKLSRITRGRRPPRMVDGRLSVAWAYTRDEGADIYAVGGDGTRSADRHLVIGAFVNEPVRMLMTGGGIDHVREKSLAEELIDRGYDITTLRFSIDKLPQHVPQPVPHVEHPPARADGQQHGNDGEGEKVLTAAAEKEREG